MKSAALFAALLVTCGASAFAQTDTASPTPAVTVPPAVLKEVKPSYPDAALAAGVAGTVELECVVAEDGSVRDVRVVKSLETSLDEEAIRALKQWQFKPGTRDGKPVPVMVTIEMSFTFRPRGPKLDSPEVYKVGDGVLAPNVLKEVKPAYPFELMREGVQGAVELECVVLPDGTVGDVRVVKPLHPQLDAEAMKAVRQWRFEPGTRDSKAVPVQVTMTMTFTVK